MSKLTPQKWLLLPHLWARDCPVTDAMEDAEADSQTAVDEWAAYNRVAALPNVSTHLVVDDTYHFVDPTAGAHTHTHKMLNPTGVE